MPRKLFLALLFPSILWLVAWSQLVLLAPPVSAASTHPATPMATMTASPISTDTGRIGVWRHYAAETPVVHALAVEGDYIWTATNGDGVIRWNRTDGTFGQYNTAAGLVHNTVRAMTLDKKGHKWFGTEGGVSEFDGQTWTTYTTTHGLIDNKVLGIAVDRAGHQWFATWGGVSKFDGRIWTAYTRASGLPSNHVYAVAVDPAGNKWFATPNGVAKFDGRQWAIYTTADGLVHNWVHAIAVDSKGRLWFGTPGGVSEFDGQHWCTYTTADGLVSNHVQAITVDNLGRVWLATPAGVSMFDGQTFQNYTPANGLPRNHITAVATDEAGQPWLGTVEGVIGLDGHTWHSFSTGSLVSNKVNVMTEDLTGRKWFATDSGVSVYDGRFWTTYTTADGLVGNQVNDLAVDSAGRLWFATQNGISTFDGQRWIAYTTADGLPDNEIKAIGRDETGQLWFNTWLSDSTPASRFDGQTWTTITDTQNLPVVWNETSVAVDEAGHKWVAAGQEGVQIADGDKTTPLTVENLSFIFTVAVDQAGSKWLGGYGGVTSFDGQQWTIYTTANGLPRNRIDQIMVDSANHKWFNTMSHGVVELDDAATPTVAQTPPPATPTLATPSPLPATSTPTPSPVTTLPTGPFPALLAELSLAPAEKTLQRAVLDQAAHRLYMVDDGGRLYIVDTTTLTELAASSTGLSESNLTLDPSNHRLYVYPRYGQGPVTVIDTTTLALTGVISPGGEIALDSARNQVYIDGQVYDGYTLQPVGQWPWQWGVYNPLRDELIRGGISLWGVDRQTQRLARDILPDFTAQECYDCGGTGLVEDIHLFPEQNLIVVAAASNSPGHGAAPWPDLFFDATTLDELTDLTGVAGVESACNSIRLNRPINGRIYREETHGWSYYYSTLLVYGPDGEVETWRDGTDLGVTNPNTAQTYLSDYGRLQVLDLSTLSPLGTIPGDCVLNLDLVNGRIYVRRGGDLLIFSEQGGQPELPSPAPSSLLPEGAITAVKVSPDYAADQTIFVQVNGQIYRSTDGGLSWAQLRGGLPEKAWLDFDMSPDFARDRTLFVGGDYGYGQGAGAYRSIDGGDTWQAIWNGLAHLRVTDVVISPNYTQDGTLLAYAKYSRFFPSGGEGGSVFRSTNRGLNWTLVITGTGSYPELPTPEKLFPPDSLPAVQFRPIQYGVERSNDGGRTWQAIIISHRPEFSALTILLSPAFRLDQTAYILSNEALYRSTDGGDTWKYGFDQFLAGRTYTNTMKVIAVSPPLKDGSQRLFLGSAAGEFWTLNPAEIKWQPVPSASQWPTVLAGERVSDIATAPNGDVWLGTPTGLVRYADETIQARYTITDGLPVRFARDINLASDGTIWMMSEGVVSFDGQMWQHYDIDDLVDGYVIDMAVGADGSVWVEGQNRGVLRWDGRSWETLIDPERHTGYRTHDIAGAPDGTMWFITADGVIWYKDAAWFNANLDGAYKVAIGSDGATYFLTGRDKVQRYANGEWSTLPQPTSGSFLDRDYGLVSLFYIARDGAAWVGTEQGGAFRSDGQTWQQFTAQDGLPGNHITAIVEDASGQLWFGTDNGAAHMDPSTLGLSPVVW